MYMPRFLPTKLDTEMSRRVRISTATEFQPSTLLERLVE